MRAMCVSRRPHELQTRPAMSTPRVLYRRPKSAVPRTKIGPIAIQSCTSLSIHTEHDFRPPLLAGETGHHTTPPRMGWDGMGWDGTGLGATCGWIKLRSDIYRFISRLAGSRHGCLCLSPRIRHQEGDLSRGNSPRRRNDTQRPAQQHVRTQTYTPRVLSPVATSRGTD